MSNLTSFSRGFLCHPKLLDASVSHRPLTERKRNRVYHYTVLDRKYEMVTTTKTSSRSMTLVGLMSL